MLFSQYYFPPKTGTTWETTNPNSLGWCQDSIISLYNFLDSGKTKGFIVLKDGKIVLEQYFNGHGRDSAWYWASAGKTMVSFLIGKAQEQGFLNISDSTSQHLGKGWTSLTQGQEGKISIKDQLCMTTGLDYTQADCIAPICLTYWKDAGTGWHYHNPPYSLLRTVLENATGKNINTYMVQELTQKTGISGSWFFISPNNVLFSTTRSMARFGSLILNKGKWDGATILGDTNYIKASVNTSQTLNKSYGYLWWLNGKESYKFPGTTLQFNGPLLPDAPSDMYAGIGKDGQYVSVIPSQNMVVIRMGQDPDNLPVPTDYLNRLFKKIGQLSCNNSNLDMAESNRQILVYPNPSNVDIIQIKVNNPQIVFIYNSQGQLVKTIYPTDFNNNIASLENLPSGIYIANSGGNNVRFVVN